MLSAVLRDISFALCISLTFLWFQVVDQLDVVDCPVLWRSGALSIKPKIPKISVGTSNGTDHFGLVRPEYLGPALNEVLFDRSGHSGTFIEWKAPLEPFRGRSVANFYCYRCDYNSHLYRNDFDFHFQEDNARKQVKIGVLLNCHYAKISGNFGPNVKGTVRPRWKFLVKVVHLQRSSSLTGRFGPIENWRSILRNFCFQSHFSLPHKAKVQAVHLNLFFSSGFHTQFFKKNISFKDKYITGFSKSWRCFPTFFS